MDNKPPPHPIAVELRKMRRWTGETQQQIAVAVGTSASAISEWETGATIPMLDRAERWANQFGLTIVLAPMTEEPTE